MPNRYSELRGVASALKVDAVALVPGPNFERLYGKSFPSHERPFVIVVPVAGRPAALVPNLELASFALINFEGEVFDWRDQGGYGAAFKALTAHLGLSSLAVEGQVMRVFVHHAFLAAQPDLTIIDGETAISGLRLCKSAAEIAAIETAVKIAETALEETLDTVRIGQTEKDIENVLTQALFRAGAEAHAFEPLVASGEHSARSHAAARAGAVIRDGDALLIDFGARASGVVSDITRTVFVGHATDEAQAVYETVLAANTTGHAATRAGVTAHDVDDRVISVLEASPFADRIRTKTGHGMGREVHEAPYIMRGNTQMLEPGMVFTIEPGLYKSGAFGVRIEDDVVVTETGCWSLTTFPKDLRVVG